MKAVVDIAVSLDGFIARRDGSLDWLPGADGEDYGFGAFMEIVDMLIMGRRTYEKALTFGEWPHRLPVVVLSSRPPESPASPCTGVEWMYCPPGEVVDRLSARGAELIYVDGGVTIQRFLDAVLIDRLILTRVPVLIGDGVPLFGPLRKDITLRHVETRSFATGLVQSAYDVVT